MKPDGIIIFYLKNNMYLLKIWIRSYKHFVKLVPILTVLMCVMS